jgi:hypothetical protein
MEYPLPRSQHDSKTKGNRRQTRFFEPSKERLEQQTRKMILNPEQKGALGEHLVSNGLAKLPLHYHRIDNLVVRVHP